MDKIENLQESRAATVIGVTAFVLSVATAAVSARVYTRAVLLKTFGADDWMAIIAMMNIFASGFCVAWNTNYGFGKHIYILDGPTIMLYLRCFYVSIVFYNMSLFCIKMTFMLQYYRVLATTKRTRTIMFVAGSFVAGWSLSQVFVQIFICQPIEAFWNSDAGGKCIPNIPQWYINAGGNIITDILVFVLPLPIIRQLKLGNSQKYMLTGIFCLGFFTCAISVVRIKFLKLTEDATWDNVDSAGWSIGELCSGITCACLPTLRPLLVKFAPRLGTSANASYGSRTGASKPSYGGSSNVRSVTNSRARRTMRQDSQEEIYPPVGLGSAEKGFRAREVRGWAELSDSGHSDEVELPSRNLGKAHLTTQCIAGDDRGPNVPPKALGIQVECDIVQTTSPNRF